MADGYIGRSNGASPSTEFVRLSGSAASTPGIIITATIVGSALTIHTADANAVDVLYVQVYNHTGGTITVYGQLGTTATTSSIPLSLTTKSSGFLFNGAPITSAGVVSVWNDTATTGCVVVGSVQRTYI